MRINYSSTEPHTKESLALAAYVSLSKVTLLAYEIRASDVYEDRLEYSPFDLEEAYDIGEKEANILFAILHNID
jgi:hypothetical protein